MVYIQQSTIAVVAPALAALGLLVSEFIYIVVYYCLYFDYNKYE